jgi:arylsulfatase A-like enzyme
MRRRTVLFAPLALHAQPNRPGLTIVWIESSSLPEQFMQDSVVFPRAYSACPEASRGRRALETGRFPHAVREDDQAMKDHFTAGDTITVATTVSADGADSPFDTSLRVPLAIRWPGRLTPRIAAEVLISHVDVLPTLLALAGIAAPAGLQGQDLSALLSGRGPLPEAVYAQGKIGYEGEWRMLVRGFDKIIWNIREEPIGLYNLAEDPAEENSLLGRREHELTRDSMMALAREWMRRLGDRIDPSGLRRR